MARRGRGEGTIRRRASDGRWEAIATLGDQRRSFYGKTRAEVREKLAQAQRDHEQGAFIGDARQTVEQYMASWLESKRPPALRQSTYDSYESRARLHINAVIGRVRLSQLSAQHVQQVTAHCASAGLSAGMTGEIFGILRQALKAAVRLGLLTQNVTDRVPRPKRRRREMRALSSEEAQRLLTTVLSRPADARVAPLYQLALSTGMRQGELLALKWRDVDLDGGRLSVVASLTWRGGAPVYSETKTRRSRRQIALTPYMVEALRQQRHWQRRQRIAVGPAWQGDRYDAVFTDELGFPLQDDVTRRHLVHALDAAALPRIRFHDLRHTAATLLLARGVNPKIVSEMLGHASVAMTLDIYSHVLPHMQDSAAREMAAALGW